MSTSSTVYFLVLFIGINLGVRFFLVSGEKNIDIDKAQEMFLNGQYTEFLEEVDEDQENGELGYRKTLALIKMGNLEQAYQDLLRKDSKEHSLLSVNLLKVLSLIKKGNYHEADSLMRTIPNLPNIWENSVIQQLRGLVLIRKGGHDTEAEKAITLSIINDSNAPYTYLLRGANYALQGEKKLAYKDFIENESIQVVQDRGFVDYWRAITYFRQKEYEKARIYFSILRKNRAKYDIPGSNVGYYYIRSTYSEELMSETIQLVSQVENEYPENAANQIRKGRAFKELGENELARNTFVYAHQLRPYYYEAINDMIKMLDRYYIEGGTDIVEGLIKENVDKYKANELMLFSRSRDLIGEVEKSQQLQAYIRSKFPEYSPAKKVFKKEQIVSYIIYWLRGEDDKRQQIEEFLFEKFPLERDINILVGTQRIDDTSRDIYEAERYFQSYDIEISRSDMLVYLTVFYGFIQREDAPDIREEFIVSGRVDLDEITFLKQKLMSRWLAHKAGDEGLSSELLFEIEALRGINESLEHEDLEKLFTQAFKTYRRYRNTYLGEDA